MVGNSGLRQTDVQIYNIVRGIIVSLLDIKETEVTPTAKLVHDLGADSLGIMELLLSIEEGFKVIISDEEAETLITVQDIINFIVGYPERLTLQSSTKISLSYPDPCG